MRLSRIAFFDAPLAAGQEDSLREAPPSVLLLKFGSNAYTKGGERGSFEFAEADAERVVAEFAARGRDLVVDYEHQTLSGAKAPAAAWISSLEKTVEGLAARIKYWTSEAQRLLRNGEYRYLSPVLCFSRSGRSVSAIHSVALTNHPALHEAPALVADDSPAGAPSGLQAPEANNNVLKGVLMNGLLKQLGLLALADASEAEKASAVEQELASLLKLRGEVLDFLQLHDCDTLAEASGVFAAAVPKAEKERLEAALRKRDAETAVAKAFADGKLCERSRPWAAAFAERDLAAFNDWAEAAPRVVPDNDVEQASRPAAPSAGLGAEELEVFRVLGLSDVQIEKLKKGE